MKSRHHESSHSPKTNRESLKYYKDLKIKIFKLIFAKLDKEETGYLSMKNLRLTTLNFDTINILSPILSKIESSTKQVSRKEFIKKCNKLYEKLNPKQRETILRNKRYKFVKEKRESFDFEPKNYHKECKLKESKVFLIFILTLSFNALLLESQEYIT